MNTTILPSILAAMAIAAATAPSRGEDDRPAVLTVAVLDFSIPEAKGGEGSGVAALLTALLSSEESLHLVERTDLAKLLDESELTLAGAASGEQAAKIGRLTGAQAIITGRMFPAGNREFLVGKCIGTETGRVFGHSIDYEKGGDFADAAGKLAEALKETLTKQQKEFLAAVETPEARISRLRKMVEGKKLPAVFVSISEEHLSRRVPDPAAQVEIQRTLQELGFPLVDEAKDAAVLVTGEAFSEMAGRHGNFVACRARAEVKVSVPGGKEIQVDRETSVALDLAEHIAAKSALQEAGARLSERLLVHLVGE